MMRWSTRLRAIGLFVLLACHLAVASYYPQDYQLWDWRDRERKRTLELGEPSSQWEQEANNNGGDYFGGQLSDGGKNTDRFVDEFNNVIITRWPAKDDGPNYIDNIITAAPSILSSRHKSVNQHIDHNSVYIKDRDSDVKDKHGTASDDGDDDDDDDGSTRSNINVLNVSSKDSPYALINKYFPEREENYEGM